MDAVLEVILASFKESEHPRDEDGQFAYSDSKTIDKKGGGWAHRFDAHKEGKNIGFAVMKKRGSDVALDDVRVLPEAQKQGVGSELVKRAVGRYSDRKISLKVSPHYSKALSTEQLKKWYGKHGFVDEGNDVMVRKP